VRAVAARAKVAPATAYTYFSSKNHLIAEIYLDLIRRVDYFTDVNDSTAVRVEQSLRSLALVVADEPEVAAACTTALLRAMIPRCARSGIASARKSTSGSSPHSGPTPTRGPWPRWR
jgi:AcrR family transcriptional regulator